jgi:hypothetical protein
MRFFKNINKKVARIFNIYNLLTSKRNKKVYLTIKLNSKIMHTWYLKNSMNYIAFVI